MARTDFTTVIDPKTGKVSQLKRRRARAHGSCPSPHVADPARRSARGTIRIIDGATDMVVADIPGGNEPDGATMIPRPSSFS
jgi:DNA-binding beta-propeller fold protein YncE